MKNPEESAVGIPAASKPTPAADSVVATATVAEWGTFLLCPRGDG